MGKHCIPHPYLEEDGEMIVWVRHIALQWVLWRKTTSSKRPPDRSWVPEALLRLLVSYFECLSVNSDFNFDQIDSDIEFSIWILSFENV